MPADSSGLRGFRRFQALAQIMRFVWRRIPRLIFSAKEDGVMRNIALPIVIALSFTVAAILAPAFFDPFSLTLTLGGGVSVTCFSYSKKQLRELLLAIRALIV